MFDKVLLLTCEHRSSLIVIFSDSVHRCRHQLQQILHTYWYQSAQIYIICNKPDQNAFYGYILIKITMYTCCVLLSVVYIQSLQLSNSECFQFTHKSINKAVCVIDSRGGILSKRIRNTHFSSNFNQAFVQCRLRLMQCHLTITLIL